jgi:hypothetical protein
LSFGAGSYDVYLVKTDSIGDTLWTRTYGGTTMDVGQSVAQTADGGYIVAGATFSYGAGMVDVYLIKTDSVGDTAWTRTYGDSDFDGGESVAQTSDGGYIVTGYTESYGAGMEDAYLIKADSLGDTLWTNTFGGNDEDWGYSVTQTADGGYIIAGWTSSYGAGMVDFYLIKTDPLGVGIQEKQDKRQAARDIRLTCHPNPFTFSTTIAVEGLTDHQNTRISELNIYDITGRLVKKMSLAPCNLSLGAKATWDGRDEDGKVLPPGIYFLKLNSQPVGKVVKVR